MTPATYVKIGLALLVAAVLFFAGREIHQRIYDSGVKAERAVWLEAQAKAAEEQRLRELTARDDSFEATDKAAAKAEDVSRGTTAATEKSLEKINYVYVDNPQKAASCRPDGGPAPIPVDVLRELDLASAAVGAAGAAAR